MSGINKAIIVGRCGNEPDIRRTPDNKCVANLSIATSEKYKDKNGEQKEVTEWHKVVFFGKSAEIVEKYVHKGSQIYVEGKIKTEKYQDKTTGTDKYVTKIYANELQLLGSKEKEGDYQSEPLVAHKSSVQPAEEFDDMIPF